MDLKSLEKPLGSVPGALLQVSRAGHRPVSDRDEEIGRPPSDGTSPRRAIRKRPGNAPARAIEATRISPRRPYPGSDGGSSARLGRKERAFVALECSREI